MAAAVAVTTGGLLAAMLTGALAVQIREDLHLTESSLGAAVAAFFLTSTACTAYFGRLADRLGGVVLMRLATIAAVVALASIAAFVHSFAALVPALVLSGAANGAIQPAANGFLTQAVSPERQGLAFGVKQAAIPAAGLLAGLAVPALAVTVGWRWAYAGAAVLAFVAGLLVPSTPPISTTRQTVGDVTVQRRPLIALGLGMAMGSAAVNALGAFFVLYAVDLGVAAGTAGFLAALGSLSSLLTRLLIGWQADRRERGHLQTVYVLCAAGTAGMALLAVGSSSLLVPAAIVAYGAGWGWAGLFNFAVARSHPFAPGRATGITQVGASGGAFLGPLGFGFSAEHLGYRPSWIIAAVLLLMASFVIRAGREMLATALDGRPVVQSVPR